MSKDVETVTFGKSSYAIIKEIPYKNTVFLYLSNVNDENDVLIQKLASDMDTIIPLDDEREFDLACNIFFKSIN